MQVAFLIKSWQTWTMKSECKEQALFWYQKPFLELLYLAHQKHRDFQNPLKIQKCTLLSIKTGGCPENCSYCPQSAHYQTGLKKQDLLPLEEVKKAVQTAKEQGAERFCMGAAWRSVRDGDEFDQVLEMVKIIKSYDLEACATLGMLTQSQAVRLKQAGLDAYNHNLDTSEEFYSTIIQTRTYQDRIETIRSVRGAGISVCSGGIIGMGETIEDRCSLIAELASFEPQPESVPINLLIPVEGTPLSDQQSIDNFDLIRTICVTRILIPKAKIRLSAGRIGLSDECQVLAFFAGANSIFIGEKLLTRPNPNPNQDQELITKISEPLKLAI